MSCYYNTESVMFLEDMMQGNMEEEYKIFLERMPQRGIVLDAGCGSGRDSLYFIEKGYAVVPMETSEHICQTAGEYIGQSVLFCEYKDIHFKVPFDGIWACGSLIHMPEEELTGALYNLNCYLKNEGIMYASFIYGEGASERDGIYYLDLNEERAQQIFTKAGFKVEKMWTTDHIGHDHVDIKWLNLIVSKNI